MGTTTIIAIAIGLAMDAFAVSIAIGISLGCYTKTQAFRLAFYFGFFQFIMPVFGWLFGTALGGYITAYDHWLAGGILLFIGGKMAYESLAGQESSTFSGDPTRGVTVLGLAIATSIDAFAVGLSLGMLNERIWYTSVIIGVVAAGFTVVGIDLGCRIGAAFGRVMEVLGGIILIGIGLRIILTHTILAG